MANAVDAELPLSGQAKLSIAPSAFKWKEFRTPTKVFLSGMANALQQIMPAGFTLKSCKPEEPLRPAGPLGVRCQLTHLEMQAQELGDSAGYSYFRYDSESLQACRDFYAHDDFHHLALVADEGTEAGGLSRGHPE